MNNTFYQIDWGVALTYAFVVSLGATIILGGLSSFLDYMAEKREHGISKRMRYLSNLSNLTHEEKVEIIGSFNYADKVDGVSLHKVLISFTNRSGVAYDNVECGYLFTNDHENELFDRPFNEYLIRTLLRSRYNVEEVQFSLAKLTDSEFNQIRRDVQMVRSEKVRESQITDLRSKADKSIVTPQLTVLSELKQNNLKPISQV